MSGVLWGEGKPQVQTVEQITLLCFAPITIIDWSVQGLFIYPFLSFYVHTLPPSRSPFQATVYISLKTCTVLFCFHAFCSNASLPILAMGRCGFSKTCATAA